MVNYLLKLKFDGTYFYGTQIQKNKYTVQGVLTETLSSLFNDKIKVNMCSRLDKDVSSECFVCNFLYKSETFFPCDLKYKLNRLLPLQIRILDVKFVSLDFESRRNSYKKEYVYTLHFGEFDPLNDKFVFVPAIKGNTEKFVECLKLFIGKHNFSCFYSLEDKTQDKYSIIENVKTKVKKEYIEVHIIGKSFGRYQIRYIIGAAYLYSIDKLTIQNIQDKLDGLDPIHINFKAPGNGLILKKVYYK